MRFKEPSDYRDVPISTHSDNIFACICLWHVCMHMDVFASKLYVQLNVGAANITDLSALTALTQANGQ